MPEIGLPAPPPIAAGFYDKLGPMYLQIITNDLQGYNNVRTQLFARMRSHLKNAETATQAIASWRGRLGQTMQTKMSQALLAREKAGNTPKARLQWMDRRSQVVSESLLAADVLLEPKFNSEDRAAELLKQIDDLVYADYDDEPRPEPDPKTEPEDTADFDAAAGGLIDEINEASESDDEDESDDEVEEEEED